jgi:hypothetical protein
VDEEQYRLANRLTALHLAVDAIRRDEQLPAREAALVDRAHAAVEELTQAVMQGPAGATRPL